MCPNGTGAMKRKKGFLDFALFKKIVDEMAPHTDTAVLHIWGEPLLHPRIFDMIKYCASVAMKTEISTNATLLNENNSKRILDSGLEVIYLCLDGTTKETYQKIRRGADFEVTVKNIQRFLEMKKERALKKPFVNLQIIEMKETEQEIEKFKKIWDIPEVDNLNIKAFDSWAGQIPEIAGLNTRAKLLPKKRFPCPNLWYHVHIYWDGTLVCCDRDFDAKYPLGNVSDGVMNAWNGGKMVELRLKHVLNRLEDVPTCSGCTEWSWWKPTPFTSHGNAPQDY
jgi:MoaA/NifB/PqqE/SkfB family radical SAM enzyme